MADSRKYAESMTIHSLRVPAGVWNRFVATAKAYGDDGNQLLRDFIADYLNTHPVKTVSKAVTVQVPADPNERIPGLPGRAPIIPFKKPDN